MASSEQDGRPADRSANQAPDRSSVPAWRRPADTGAGWRPLEAVPVFLVAVLVAAAASLPLATVASLRVATGVSDLIFRVVLGITVLGTVLLFHRSSLRGLGWPGRPVRELALGFLFGIGLYVVVGLIVAYLLSLLLSAASGKPTSTPPQLPSDLSGVALGLAGVSVLMASCSEELFFRAFLFRSLRRKHGFVYAGLLSSAIFASFHYIPAAWEDTVLLIGVIFFVGLGLAFICEWRDNVAVAMGAHAAFNVIGFALIVLVHG